jgi:hypothetical protein
VGFEIETNMINKESFREIAVQLRQNFRIKGDSGKRQYTLESGVEGSLTLGGYCISVSDPVTKRFIGKMHPISFIEMILEGQ